MINDITVCFYPSLNFSGVRCAVFDTFCCGSATIHFSVCTTVDALTVQSVKQNTFRCIYFNPCFIFITKMLILELSMPLIKTYYVSPNVNSTTDLSEPGVIFCRTHRVVFACHIMAIQHQICFHVKLYCMVLNIF